MAQEQTPRVGVTPSDAEHMAMLEAILDDSNQMVQLSTLDDLRMVYANAPACNYTGHAGQDYHGCHCYQYMMGLSEQCPFCPLLAMDDGAEPAEVDNGEQVFAVKTKVIDYGGRPAFIEYARDITQMRRAQQAFESQMQTLLRSIPEAQGVMHFDLTADECLSVNGSATNSLKSIKAAVPVDETMGQIFAFVPDEALRTELLGVYNRQALLAAYDAGSVEVSRETPSYFDDGSIRTARVTARLLPNPTTNHIECVFYGLDITEEVEKREALDRKLHEQIAISNALSRDYLNVFLVKPKQGTIEILKLDGYVTPGISAGSTEEYRYDTVRENYVNSRVHPEDQQMMMDAISLKTVTEVMGKQEEYVSTYRALVDGKTCWYQFKYVRLGGGEKVIAGFQNVDAIINDQRERQETLAAALAASEQASIAKSTFLSSMSHDIRTPLNAILGFAGLARGHVDDRDALLRDLDKVETSGHHLLSLINDVLDVSSIESGKNAINEAPVNLLTLVEELKTVMVPSAAEKGVSLEFDVATLAHADVLADEVKIKKVLVNVLSNAVKFTPAGGRVHFALTEDEDLAAGRPRYEFVIADNGIGMDPQFVDHVFETFSREPGTGIQGTGLGMSIAKSLVDLMGGTISVVSEKGHGSTFTVTLRLEPTVEVACAGAQVAPQTAQLDSLEGRRVLLVEDNELNREIATEILKAAGVVVETAADGAAAVDAVAADEPGHFDVVLMDVQMPKMNGYEATRAIRALDDPARAGVPILAVTANAFDSDRAAALAAGMDGHIAKPISVASLLGAMNELLAK